MTPTPQEFSNHVIKDDAKSSNISAERIVVSGMSGRFPKARNIKQFSDLLYNKVNPVTMNDKRWKFKHPEMSNYVGKVSDLHRFDAQFFKVHNRQGNTMEPMSRQLLELAYEAIYDAGLNPSYLDGKKVGVFIAASLSETENIGFFNEKSKGGFGITGTSKTMYANRISYWLNTKGPSVTIDSACCGSTVVLEQAFLAMSRGECATAIVGASNLCLQPHTMINYNRCISIAADGKTKSFADNADGCAKSEAINVMVLQKSGDALRIYGEVINVKNEFISRISDETGQKFGFNRELESFTSFLKQFYEEVNVLPDAVEYVEGFGSASPQADKTELLAIENTFCGNRTDPLFVGSVMSNVGFTDAASGFTAMIKVLLGYHTGIIPSNLHCETPRKDVPALCDGRMQIVREHQPFRSTYTAVNGLSVTGVNSHILLHGCLKPKDNSKYKSAVPRLVTISTREETGLNKIFQDLQTRPIDPEEIALLHNIHENNISGHLGRGYIILDTDDQQKTRSLGEKAVYINDGRRPLWFVYSGMGSQWAGMGTKLMRIPIFAAAVERCRQVLEPLGIDLVNIITSPDKSTFDNIQNSFIGIAMIQIGLTDILRELGLTPDNIIGHSVGELACAYADGCLTAEQMIMAAYYRGKVSLETKFIRGAMAAVGLGTTQISKMCPPEVEVACHNGPESCTISGPADKITEFVKKLTTDGIFAKEVPCSNIAYHSRYIAAAGPHLLNYLSKTIENPKPRSKKWLSTSVPQDKWEDPSAMMCSADYLTNNLLSPVLFEETSRLIPSNAVLIEIAPHGLLQAILKRSLPENCKNIALTKREHPDNTVFLLNAIGQLYVEGFSPKVQALYPKVEFPVSTGTPHLSHHVEWMHSEQWNVYYHEKTRVKTAASCNFVINLHDNEHSYLKGNIVQGKIIYPFAAALVAVWDTLAMTIGTFKKNLSVQFRDIHLYSQPILHDQRQSEIYISLHRGSGRFHIMNGSSSKVASGFISALDEDNIIITDFSNQLNQTVNIDSEEVYQNLNTRGYTYRDPFRSIHKVNEDITEAQVIWNDNWVVLIDSMLQLNSLRHPYHGVAQPSQIRELVIDVDQHFKLCSKRSELTVIKAIVDPTIDSTLCGGVVLRDVKFQNMAIAIPDEITLDLKDPSNSIKIENKMIHKSENEKQLALEIGNIADINTLHWNEISDKSRTTGDGIKVKVQYAGLNLADTKRAYGVIPFENDKKAFGIEFSGITECGDRVMGLVANGAISTVVTAQPDLMWPVPSHWSLEDAATVPLAYAQAFYCLMIKNKLVKNSKILIHGGSGALGQAAISIALAMECTIFTTVSDQSKKRFLLRLFPQLREEYIGNSRDNFADLVLNATNKEGCDIVLSCIRGDLRNESLKCTALWGATVDTSLLQSRDEFELGMEYMDKCAYMIVDFKSIFDPKSYFDAKKIQELVSEGIAQGYVRPLSRVSFMPNESPRAFHFLATSRHRGRVLLRLRDQQPMALPRVSCSPNLGHVIFCDGDSAGLQMADKLVDRGATNLKIHFFNPSSQQRLKMRCWKNIGVNVEASFGKTLTYDKILQFLNRTEQVEGIYVIATDNSNTKDIFTFVNQVDRAASASCPQLKYFAVVSTDSNIGTETRVARSTTVVLPNLIKVNKDYNLKIDDSTWNKVVVDVIERALQCNQRVLVAIPRPIKQLSLLQQIGNIISGSGNLLNYNDDTTLRDLGIENEEMNIISTYLHDTYHISLDDKDILELTKHKIRQIELSAVEEIDEPVNGLHTFISYVDADELLGTTDFILLDTLVTSTVGSELDLNESYLSIVPGMEGHHERFRYMCEALKLQAVVLQPGLDFQNETPKDLAQRYCKVLLNKLGVKSSFYLLGYESGVTVALELAAMLEAHGKTGTVFCLGDSPDGIRAQVEAQLAGYPTEEALQVEVITHMFRLMSVKDTSVLDSTLQSCSTWEERVTACVSVLLGQVSHSAQYVRAVIGAAYKRLLTAKTYSHVPHKLRSKVVLMRTKSSKTSLENNELQQLSEQTVDVFELNSHLAHATKDLRCPGIVNRYLSKDLLEFYETKNLCISYAFEI